jgi:hypothetical protein
MVDAVMLRVSSHEDILTLCLSVLWKS